jgi:hypothetical protein
MRNNNNFAGATPTRRIDDAHPTGPIRSWNGGALHAKLREG